MPVNYHKCKWQVGQLQLRYFYKSGLFPGANQPNSVPANHWGQGLSVMIFILSGQFCGRPEQLNRDRTTKGSGLSGMKVSKTQPSKKIIQPCKEFQPAKLLAKGKENMNG